MMSFIGFVLLLMFKSIRPEAFNTFGWIILFLLCSIVSIYNISGCYKQDTYININELKTNKEGIESEENNK